MRIVQRQGNGGYAMNVSTKANVEHLLEKLHTLDKKNSKPVVKDIFTSMKVNEFSSQYKYSQDEYMVDLSSFDDQSLHKLHQVSNWQYPSYFLRKKMLSSWDSFSEEDLLFLLQLRSPKAKEILFKRYEGKYENAKDEVLVLMAQHDDEIAKNTLIERYYNVVQQMSYWLKKKYQLQHMNEKDIAHESIIGLYKAVWDYKIQFKKTFREFSKFVIDKHIGTVKNTMRNFKNRLLDKSFSFHMPLRDETDATFEDTLVSDTYYPEEMLLKKKEFYAIWATLTPLERKVLLLYGDGYKYEDAAKELNANRKVIDNAIQRIRTKGEEYRSKLLVSEL